MTSSDLELVDISYLLRASKRRSYKLGVMERHQIFIKFLQDNQLANRQLLENDDSLPEDFRLVKSDLTEEGYELFRLGLEKWMAAIANGKPVEGTSILEKELAKIRSKSD